MTAQDNTALAHMSCTTVALLFAGSIALWIVVGYGIGRWIGAW